MMLQFARVLALKAPILISLTLIMMLATTISWADAPKSAAMSIRDGWVRAVPPVSRATAAYMTIDNQSKHSDTLLYVASDAAKTVELHTVIAQPDGSRAMKQVAHIAVSAGKSVQLAPGGYHIMLIDLVKPLKSGETVEVQLVFQKAGKMNVSLPVKAAHSSPAMGDSGGNGAMQDAESEDHSHHHHHH